MAAQVNTTYFQATAVTQQALGPNANRLKLVIENGGFCLAYFGHTLLDVQNGDGFLLGPGDAIEFDAKEDGELIQTALFVNTLCGLCSLTIEEVTPSA